MKWWTIPVVAGLGAVLLVGVVSLRGVQTGGAPQSISGGSCTGLTVIGTPGPTTLNGVPVWKMDVTPNCPASYITGTFGSAWLREKTGGLFDFDSGFTITATASDESLAYPVMNDRITLEELAYTGGAGDPGVICSIYQGGIYKGHSPVARGAKGHLEVMPNPVWHADLALTLETGESITKRISSTDTFAEWTRDNETIATAGWSGYSLLAGQKPPDPTGVVAVYAESLKKWNLAWLAEWDAYRDATTRTCTGQQATVGNLDTTGRIAAQNAALSALFSSAAALPVPGSFSADGSGYVVTAAPRFQLPVITIYIKGEVIGMRQAGGIPTLRFDGVKDPPYYAGSPGTLKFAVGNLANESAGFDLTGTCSGAPLFQPQRFSLNAKEQRQVLIPFTVSAAGSYNCEAALTDLSTGAAAKSVKATVALAVQLCQPGQSKILTLYRVDQCKADGSAWETVLDCSQAVTEIYRANTCVAGANFGLVGSNATTKTAAATWAAGGPQPPGSCTYDSSALSAPWLPGGGSACSAEDRVVGTETALGLTAQTCRSLGTIAPKTYEVRASAPVQFAGGQFTCAGAANSPQASVVSVREVPDSATAPLPTSVPASSLATPAPAPGGAPGGAPPPTPGFDAVFAVAGLLAVAWLVNRRKR